MGSSKSYLPSFEILLIAVFFAFFLIWMVPKCASTATGLQEKQAETKAKIDSLDRIMDSLAAKPVLQEPQNDSSVTAAAAQTKVIQPGAIQPASKLYITINDLKLRRGPHLDSSVVGTLPLFEEVFFTGEVTEFTQEISLGYEIADEPWIKIRTSRGLEGWVYGAGVHYYKKKRTGVLE